MHKAKGASMGERDFQNDDGVTKIYEQWQGPVRASLSRFDRFLLIGPCTKGGLALRQLTNTNLHLLSKLIVNISGVGPVFFNGFWETKTALKSFQRSLKTA